MNTTENILVNTLCRWVTVKLAPSEIDGVGVFAIKDMPKGTKLYADIMPEVFKLPYKMLKNNTPEYVHDTLVQRWPLVRKDSPFVYPDVRFVAFMNHGGDDANYDAVNDVLLRNVEAGEEITEDYRKIEGWEETFPFLV